jgi:hypothetical protein
VRAYDLMGQRIRVPTNYNPLTKAYTGVWNGTFKVAWTDNPAWIYYDLLTNERYGLGRYFSVSPALKWELYAIGQYCDAMVPDGNSGLEPRFKCGVYIATREQAYKVLQDMAAVFRGMAYWAASDVRVVQDAPSDPVAHFTAANVIEGRFTYAGASQSQRHTQVVVWFNSRAELGRLVPEVVVDRELTAKYGVRTLELSPLGVWSRGQAQRIGKWALYSEAYEGQTVAFRVGMDGALVAPGQVFEVADPNEAGERLGGRVRSAVANAVTLDAPVTLASGETYTLTVMLPDPADPTRLVRQSRTVINAPGAGVGVIGVAPAFSAVPAAQTVWLLQSEGVRATSWRCLSVKEIEDSNEYEITGLRHYPEKYALVEQGIKFETPSVSRIPRVPPAPASLVFNEVLYRLGGERRSRVTVSWPEPAVGLNYLLAWRQSNGPWTDMPATSDNCIDIDALPPGPLEVAVKSRNALGALSPAKTGGYAVQGSSTALGGNLIDPTWWRPGAPWEWLRDTVQGNSSIVWGVGPKGSPQALWQMSGAGGWTAEDPASNESPKNKAAIDPLRTYRFVVPVLRTAAASTVQARFGPGAGSGAAARVCALNSTTDVAEPWFWTGALPLEDKWYLIVGYVFPAGSTGVAGTAGGVYRMDTGARIADVTNFCWKAGAPSVRTRAGSTAVSGTPVLQFAPPVVELVDGTEGAYTDGQAGPQGAPGAPGASLFTWIVRGSCVGAGPLLSKPTGTAGFNSDGRSAERYVGACYASARGSATGGAIFGLAANAAVSVLPANIDYAWHFREDGFILITEQGNETTTAGELGSYNTDTVAQIAYDGDTKLRYFLNGVMVREVTTTPNRTFGLQACLGPVPSSLPNIVFGPSGRPGSSGTPGQAGDKTADVRLYQWATAQPSNPSGQSTYTWASSSHTAYTGGGGWAIGVPANPGGSGIKLWVAEKRITAAAAATSTTVSWASGFTVYMSSANGDPGSPGVPGTQAGKATVWQWALSIPAAPTGSATYNWATQSFGAPPSGWALQPGNPPSPGVTLWAAEVSLFDAATSATTFFTWSVATVSARGYAGTNGPAGGAGASARVAYAKTTSSTLATSPPFVQTAGNASFPPANSWGGGEVWGATLGALAAGEKGFVSDGIYNPATDQTLWAAPYEASLKVGTLSAITVNTGALSVQDTITISTTGSLRWGAFGFLGGTIWAGYQEGTYKQSWGNTTKGAAWTGGEMEIYGGKLVSGRGDIAWLRTSAIAVGSEVRLGRAQAPPSGYVDQPTPPTDPTLSAAAFYGGSASSAVDAYANGERAALRGFGGQRGVFGDGSVAGVEGECGNPSGAAGSFKHYAQGAHLRLPPASVLVHGQPGDIGTQSTPYVTPMFCASANWWYILTNQHGPGFHGQVPQARYTLNNGSDLEQLVLQMRQALINCGICQ